MHLLTINLSCLCSTEVAILTAIKPMASSPSTARPHRRESRLGESPLLLCRRHFLFRYRLS